MECRVCQQPCVGEGVLTDGSAFHHGCYKQLLARSMEFAHWQLPPTQFDREISSEESTLAQLRDSLKQSRSIGARLQRVFAGDPTREPGIVASIERRQVRLNELQEAAMAVRRESEARVTQERHRIEQTLRDLYDNWTTYPPDWDERTRAARRLSPTCSECGSSSMIHVHHIVALGQGGSNRSSNLKVLCEGCHSRKHGGANLTGSVRAPSKKLADKVNAIQQAMDQGQCIRFNYRKYEGDKSTRTIKPESFSQVGARDMLCVSGYCYLRETERIFAVRRMSRIRVVDEPL